MIAATSCCSHCTCLAHFRVESYRPHLRLSPPLCCKEALNVFNYIQPLFEPFLAPILCSQHLPASFTITGGVGASTLSGTLDRQRRCDTASSLSAMFSAKYELLYTFCNARPLFSSLYELSRQKHPGWGEGVKNSANKRCA